MPETPPLPNVTADDIRRAADFLAPLIIDTPMIQAPSLSGLLGCSLHLKLENLQYTSSFKVRGAAVAMAQLTEEQKQRGQETLSSLKNMLADF